MSNKFKLRELTKYKYGIMTVLVIINIFKNIKVLKDCSSLTGKIAYIIHCVFSVYLYFGWIFFENKKLHLLITVLVLIHWIINKKCIITTITNELCGYDVSDKFQDILYHLNLEKYNKDIHYIIITMIIIIDIYMIKKS
tara:strand:+ start:91 stop:507 length:417 start_codon:yes stop_codon:yes gene_type:complete